MTILKILMHLICFENIVYPYITVVIFSDYILEACKTIHVLLFSKLKTN